MTEANLQLRKENQTWEPVYLERWCRDKVYKIKNTIFASSNRWEIPYTTIQMVPLWDTGGNKKLR